MIAGTIRSIPPRRAALIAALSSLVFLSGCVYLRLLEVQKQLKNIETNYVLSGDPEFVIHFNEPVLLRKDMRFLLGGDPQRKSREGEERIWYYDFEMVRSFAAPPTPLERIELTLRFNDKKLVDVVVPENFQKVFSRRVIVETARLAPAADILKLKRVVRAKGRLPAAVEAELPGMTRTLELLGPPLVKTPEAGGETWLYRYRLAGTDADVPIVARFTFSHAGALTRFVILWDTATIDVTFERA